MNYITNVDTENFFIVISVCAILCTIAVVFGKDKARKTIVYPIKIITIILIIGAVLFLGYQIVTFGLDFLKRLPLFFWIFWPAILISHWATSNEEKKKKLITKD
jgi:hypothetical protein